MSEVVEALSEGEQKFFESGGETLPEQAMQVDEAKTQTFVEAPAKTEVAPEQSSDKTDSETQPKKLVPLEALHEARSQNRELRAQLQRDAQARKALEDRFAELERKLNPANEVPSYDVDPITNLNHRLEETTKKLNEINQTKQEQEQHNQIVAWYQQQSAQFATQQNDFMDAYNAWTKLRADELFNAGLTQDQAQAQFKQDELLIATAAARLGINPAQMIYSIAQSKGYKPKPVIPAKSLETVKKGVESSKSLEQVSGKSTQNLTLEALAEMDDADLSKNWDRVMKTG